MEKKLNLIFFRTDPYFAIRRINFGWVFNTGQVLSLLLFCCNISHGQTTFTDVTKAAGIDHQFGVFEGFLGGGICVLDFNNDTYEDFYLTGGTNRDMLFLNNGDGTFKNIIEDAGLGMTKGFMTQGVAGADVNRDGWIDLFITTINTADTSKTIPRAKNLFFLNNGDQTFRDATADYGLDQMNSFSTGVSFGDFNADGYPDAYIGNYFHDYTGELNEINDATIVNANNTAKGYLLLNQKGKRFKDVYTEYGLKHKGFGFGGLFTDFDNDGDQDLLVNHDFGYKAKPNYLLRNDYPEKQFTYVEKELDMDLRINAMAAAVGDYDNNGWLDYFITNIRYNNFMVNGGADKPFVNKSEALGTKLFKITWGANFGDFDHDGDLDLFAANGDLNPNCTPMNNFYFENDQNKFTERASFVGVNDYGISRGSVTFDFDNDGDLDILVVNQKPVLAYPIPSKTILYRNDTPLTGNWLKLALQGVNAEANGIGSRVRLVIGDQQMIREVDGGGSSHLSQNSTIVHFGLGELELVDSIIVKWTGGKEQILINQTVNQLIRIKEVGEKRKDGFSFLVKGILIVLGLALVFYFIKRVKVSNNNIL